MKKGFVLAHRGLWKTAEEKNTWTALTNALINGYGIETDVRDYQRKLVISHDMADDESILWEKLLDFYIDNNCSGTLAINIKADGILETIKKTLEVRNIKNYFVFDMSIPETVIAKKIGINYLSRKSDIELEVLYEESQGLWLDSFLSYNWITADIINQYLDKIVVLVSPELHRENPESMWQILTTQIIKNDNFLICTDYPEKFMEVSNEKN